MPEPRNNSSPFILLWRIWPWATFLLPALIVILYPKSYEQGIVYILGIVVVPCVGFLGLLPRWVLRKRGHRDVPTAIASFLVLHWWSWTLLLFTLDSSGDISTPSLLEGLTGGVLTPGLNLDFAQCAVIVGLGTWIVIVVLSLFVKPRQRVDLRRQRTVLLVSLLMPLVLLVAAALVTPLIVDQRRDFAGDTLAEVKNRPIEEQTQLLLDRYETAQGELADVRLAIQADAAWTELDGWPLGGGANCASYGADCYRLEISFFLNRQVTQPEMQSVSERLEKEGWEISTGSSGFTAYHPDGRQVTVAPLDGDASRVDYTSQSWWGDRERFLELAETSRSVEEQHLYAGDEWPPL